MSKSPIEQIDYYDTLTKSRLADASKLLSYKPNNAKFLRMHKSQSKTRLILGGRRSGKTTFCIVECAWAALGIHPYGLYPDPPLKIRYCGVSYNEGIKGIILPALYSWLPPNSINKYWAEDRVLELKNGTIIEFKSYEQEIEKYEGAERHLVIMDEEPPKEIYQSNWWRTISKDIDGKLIIAATPLHGLTWLYDELYDNPRAVPPYVEYVHVSIYDNPHLSRAAIDQVKNDPSMQDCLEAAMEGKFISKVGLIFPQFDLDKHVIEPVGAMPTNWMIVLGIDPHDRNPHGVVFMALTPDNTWIVFDEILERCTLDKLVTLIKERLGGRWPPNLAIMDTYGNIQQSIAGRSIKDELIMRYGLYVVDAYKDVKIGRERIARLLESDPPGLLVTRNCYNLIREMKHYVWDDWARRKEKKDPKERPIKKDDHLIDATRYVIASNLVYRHPEFSLRRDMPKVKPNEVTAYF